MKLQNYKTIIENGITVCERHNCDQYDIAMKTLPKEELINLLSYITHNRLILQQTKGYNFIDKLDFNIFVGKLLLDFIDHVNITIQDITLNNLLLIQKEIIEAYILDSNLSELNNDLDKTIFNKEVK